MPYASTAALPTPVKNKLKGKKLRQWMHVFNSEHAAHGDESRAFATAWATAKKLAKKTKISKEEANYKAQTIDSDHCSVCTMFVEPRACTDVKGDIAPGGWCKLFSRKSGAIGKAAVMPDTDVKTFSFFMPIEKLDKDKRIVYGYASTPARDSDGEIVTLDAVKAALPEYMQWGNIREMHRLSAVGVAQEANMDTKGLFLSAKIVDDPAWQKCLEGVYKGFSIGGRKLDKVGDKITELEMTEISIVDRPANPEAGFKIAKAAKAVTNGEGGYLVIPKVKRSPEQKALRKMAKVVEALAKDGPPAAHDGFSLPSIFTSQKPDGVTSPNDSRPIENVTRKGDEIPNLCEKHGKANCELCAVEKREFDEKKRKELASSGKAMPDGSYPIENIEDLRNAVQAFGRAKDKGKAKAHIRTRAKALDAESELPAKWSKNKAVKKARKIQLMKALGINTDDSFLTLRKGMNTVGSLSYSFDSIRNAQRSLMSEAKQEGGDMKDKKLALKLGTIAQDLAGVISQKALHEGGEALDFSDANDQYLTSMLGEDFDMDKVIQAVGGSGDPLTDAVMGLIKRAATPTRAMRMAMAKENVKKNRKACKAAREAVEEVHKMLKASYIAKASKGKEAKPDDGEIDHAGMMEKLQKAYSEIEKARTFGKAASEQIEKASGRAGERGQEAGDPDSGFYEVPAGVKDLSPAALAGAKPGESGTGGQPPLYPGDGSVYSGKADGAIDLRKFMDKDGKVPAHVAELIMEKATSDGELAALRRLPSTVLSGGRRPYAFDLTKVVAGGGGGGAAQDNDLGSTLFKGVDVSAFNSGDEHSHNAAAAKAIGNLLTAPQFGKSVFDPNFKGAAGVGR